MTSQRLTRAKWISAGLTALQETGPTSLRAEALARALGTTKGSFYWHFEDVPAFHAALLTEWQSRAFATIVSELEAAGAADERLRRFGARIGADITEPALRAWALSDANAQKTVSHVDNERLTYISALLGQLGVSNPAFANALYGSLVGNGFLATDDSGFDAMVDLVLALK
jgi:AcrR family transcriptional regulator